MYGEIPGFGDISLGLYVSDSVENGVKNMRKNLEFRWENSEFLQQYLPVAKFTDIRWEFHNADGHRLVIKGYGAKNGVSVEPRKWVSVRSSRYWTIWYPMKMHDLKQ